MGESEPWFLLGLTLAVLLCLSAFFSGSETAFFSLDRIQLSRLRESDDPVARRITRVLSTPHRLLTTALIGNTLVNVATAAVATTFLMGVSRQWGVELAVVADTALVLIFGEILPKSLAVSHPEGFSRAVARPMAFLLDVGSPVARLAAAMTKRILGVLGVGDVSLGLGFLTSREIRTLIDELGREKQMSELETRIAKNIFSFSTRPVRSVMTPRVDVVAISDRTPLDEAVKVVKQSRHTRIPVYSGSIDNIVGFINAKEFLLDPSRPIRPHYLREVIIAPENKRIDETFQEMQAARCPIVVVVSEYGETMGIVTQEDLVEEIVGEIYDEFEAGEVPLVKIAEGEYLADGLISLDDLNRELDVGLEADESVTLNGLLCEKLDRLPEVGDSVRVGPIAVKVLETDGRRCKRCRIALVTSGRGHASERRARGGSVGPGARGEEER